MHLNDTNTKATMKRMFMRRNEADFTFPPNMLVILEKSPDSFFSGGACLLGQRVFIMGQSLFFTCGPLVFLAESICPQELHLVAPYKDMLRIKNIKMDE
jgi:hypothetical protein